MKQRMLHLQKYVRLGLLLLALATILPTVSLRAQTAEETFKSLCSTCHTVVIDHGSTKLVEQGPFLEWLNSSYPAAGRSCQSCHLPVLDGPQHIAHRPPGGPFPPTSPRTPFARHEFAGGNVVMAESLGHTDASARARAQLQSSLRLSIAASRDGDGASTGLLDDSSKDDVRAEREGLRRAVDFGHVAAIHPCHVGQATALIPVLEGGVPGATDAVAGTITVGRDVNAPPVPIPRSGLRREGGKGQQRRQDGEGGGSGHSLAGSGR